MANAQSLIAELLQAADIEINGDRAWDMQVVDDRFFGDVLARGNLALGEAYMRGDWNCAQLDQFFYRLLTHKVHEKVHPSRLLWHHFKHRFFNLQSSQRAWQVGQRHYDLGNHLYQSMLDQRMVYTCGYWAKAETLEQAQADKLELVCQKLNLKAGMRILDIGCGW